MSELADGWVRLTYPDGGNIVVQARDGCVILGEPVEIDKLLSDGIVAIEPVAALTTELASLRARVATLEAELAKAKKPLLTVDEVNALDKFVGDHDFGNEHNAMLKLKAQHCTYQGHHDCYGELWECAECGDIHCCIEGGDTDIELCDSCWAEKHKEGADYE